MNPILLYYFLTAARNLVPDVRQPTQVALLTSGATTLSLVNDGATTVTITNGAS